MIEVLGQMWWVALLTFLAVAGITLASLLRRPRWGAPKVASEPLDEHRSEPVDGSSDGSSETGPGSDD